MPSDSFLNPESDDFPQPRPAFWIGQHDSARVEALTDGHYHQIQNSGYGFATAPITNTHFHQRVKALYHSHVSELQASSALTPKQKTNPSLPDPVLPTLTDEDTSLGPCPYIGNVLAYSSPWIDLGSSDPIVASLSRQALNLEIAFANWCGVRSVVVPGPRADEDGRAVAQFARAILETFDVATRVNLIIHLPMYREPGLEESIPLLSTELLGSTDAPAAGQKATQDENEIDLFGAWDTWHTIRSVCNYATRLYVALRLPKRLPEKELQTRWFAEPLHYLTLGPTTFQANKSGNPSLSRHHQDLIFTYMRLKTAPWFLLYDVGPTTAALDAAVASASALASDFPSLTDANAKSSPLPGVSPYIMYMNYLQRQQEPYSQLETETLTSFQDWLQSPLQPLSDNLESATYEMFEGDPVKYNLYEQAAYEAMSEWKTLNKPTSSPRSANGGPLELIVTVAGAGRGPLVTRALRASDRSGVPIQLWAVEKNQNAYVYLLRQNATVWGGRVNVIKTDMRDWAGPVPVTASGNPAAAPTKVDILITELLGSFGDNELSPECLDGIQRHIARPHGLSIPESYTAWLSPIATPKIHAHLKQVLPNDENAFETPWVVRLFQMDFVAQKVPGKPRFQQAWEFVHPVWGSLQEQWEEIKGERMPRTLNGGGAMNTSGGLNEHNARSCHLTFYCRPRGVCHGLGGYFESTLYTPQVEDGEKKDLVELSILPDQIDCKSRDMVSWFPIFFPLKQPLYFPQDSEIEVTMWRQTDDSRVWYEWLVEAYTWVGAKTRVKVGSSELHSSKKVACLMQ